MTIVDKALQKRVYQGNPIRAGTVGSGFIGRAIALQLVRPVPAFRLLAVGAFQHRKHVTAMNADLDATLEPILKVHADKEAFGRRAARMRSQSRGRRSPRLL